MNYSTYGLFAILVTSSIALAADAPWISNPFDSSIEPAAYNRFVACQKAVDNVEFGAKWSGVRIEYSPNEKKQYLENFFGVEHKNNSSVIALLKKKSLEISLVNQGNQEKAMIAMWGWCNQIAEKYFDGEHLPNDYFIQ